jgi:membrane-associated phospholipid phosphatase
VIVFLSIYPLLMIGWLIEEHGELVIWINQHRSVLLDQAMPLITYLGDGIFLAIVCLALLLWRWRLGLFFMTAGLIQAITSLLLKRVIFGPIPRPVSYFGASESVQLDLVPGVAIARYFSFPSGHSMTAFMLTALLSFFVPKRYHLLLLFLSFSVAFSRMYLLQHFYRDVVAGAFIGVLVASVLYALLWPYFAKLRQGRL